MAKKVLITGANSFIGTSFERYISEHYSEVLSVDTLDMTQDSWRQYGFNVYDSVFHVAGIAHSDNGKIDVEQKKRYYAINTDLTIATAEKAKAAGVKQFVFMSSAIVYGDSSPIGKPKMITADTPVAPANCYGDSKVRAEKGLLALECKDFKVVILRPPMIYGKGGKGNYNLLAKIATRLPVFPYVKNSRSMLYIENLCEFVRLMIENDERGIFWPQNSEYSNTSEMVKMIANENGKRMFLMRGFSWLLRLFSLFAGIVNKAFGNLTYEMSMSEYKQEYRIYGLKESIQRTEK